jgi:class 3 adenylate cyclase/tetratricopeptide (TPR) repeat protein
MTASAPLPASAERRSLTVMFCDVVGSTALSARLDPEDLRDVLAAYQRRATAVVEAGGGRVARYEGDGVLAYFGYPAASEDDAERAVRAGLELAAGVDTGVDTGSAVAETLSIRVGIATGVVVVGELLRSGAADNPPVVGETPNLAARLQALAEPGTVVIADATRRLTGGLFEYRDRGAQRLDGFAHPVRAWQVVKANRGASRFAALRSRSLPLVGREAELEALLGLWEQAKTGAGQVVLVSGEAGIGKSRLALELAARVRGQSCAVLRWQCSPQHQSSMLHPILEYLQRVARVRRSGTSGADLDRLATLLGAGGAATDAAVALLAELLALPAAARSHEREADAQRRRELLFEALLGCLQRLAAERPLLLVAEDAHWIDPTSRELLALLVGRMQGQTLLIVTGRPEFQPPWRNVARAATIPLRPIATAAAEALVKRIPGADQLAETTVRGIAARADGVPLFIEELTRAVLDGGALSAAPETGAAGVPVVPAGLHASLMARLDRLGRTREVARIAAALGRQFTFGLLSAVMPDRDPATLRRELQRLVNAELIAPVASLAAETYAFRHGLIQEAAYGTLLRSERRALHGRIAKALQDRFPEIIATEPEIVARHFTGAELAEPAIRYWLWAGKRAVRGWALLEAAEHFSEGIRIAGTLPPSTERQRLELDLHMGLGPVTMGTQGYAAEESLKVYQRAEPLVAAVGDVSERLMVTLGLYNVRYGRAELSEALATARDYCTLAEARGVDLGRAYGLLAQTHAAMGAHRDAAAEFQRSLDVFARTPEDVASLGVFGSQHVISLGFGAGVQYALGEPELGQAMMGQSIALARRTQHALSIALALVTDLLTPLPGGLDPDPARAGEVVRFCAQYGFRNFEAWAEFARGAMIARRGDAREGIAVMRAAVDAAESMSSHLFRPVHLATLAAAHARLAELDEALALVEKAIATMARTGERRVEPALYRLRGELLLAAGRRSDGELDLAAALQVARAQQARAEEERALKAIARLARKEPPP